MTSHAALTGSPRDSASIPKAIAPTTATAAEISLSRSVTSPPSCFESSSDVPPVGPSKLHGA